MKKISLYAALIGSIVAAPLTAAHAQHEVGDSEFTMALTGDSIITRRLAVYHVGLPFIKSRNF